MEHRWEPRINVDWEVIINSGNIGLIRARARNVSDHGIMLDTGRIGLVTGNVVTLACLSSNGAPRDVLRARAQVVHFDRGRAGLMWIERASREVTGAEGAAVPCDTLPGRVRPGAAYVSV